LFEPFRIKVAKKVRIYYEMYRGKSKYDKLPIYIKWTGKIPTKPLIDECSKHLSIDVK